jgi:hypothetical protein
MAKRNGARAYRVRQAAAVVREAARAERSPRQQIALLVVSRPGNSRRERARLAKQVDW